MQTAKNFSSTVLPPALQMRMLSFDSNANSKNAVAEDIERLDAMEEFLAPEEQISLSSFLTPEELRLYAMDED